MLHKGLWQYEVWCKGGLADSAFSIFTRYLVIRWGRSGFISSGKWRMSRCDSHAFRPRSHLLGQLSLRLRGLQRTQKELTLHYLLMDWARGQSASSDVSDPFALCEGEPGGVLIWSFPLPTNFRAQVQTASHHDPEDSHHSQQARPALRNAQSCAGLAVQQARWNSEFTL